MENEKTIEVWYNVICWYWNKHPMKYWKFECNCREKYWFSEMDLKIWAHKNNKSIYMQDLTEDDKRQCYLHYKNKSKSKNACKEISII